MVIGIMGDTCVGKSTIAEMIKKQIDAEVITGKDYLRLAKSETTACSVFKEKLKTAMLQGNIIYVISEKEQLSFLPKDAIRVLVTADLEIIKKRFANRIGVDGNLPEAISKMLERKYGLFEKENYNIHIINEDNNISKACIEIIKLLA